MRPVRQPHSAAEWEDCEDMRGGYRCIHLVHTHGVPGLPSESDKAAVYGRVKEFNRIFTVRNGTDQCSELLGENLNTPEGKDNIARKGLSQKVCEKCIGDAIEIIETLE